MLYMYKYIFIFIFILRTVFRIRKIEENFSRATEKDDEIHIESTILNAKNKEQVQKFETKY